VTSRLYSELIAKIENIDRDFFEKNKLEKPTEGKISKQHAIETLKNIKCAIQDSRSIVQDLKDLLQYVPTIISIINYKS
jgi:hypothetical protein